MPYTVRACLEKGNIGVLRPPEQSWQDASALDVDDVETVAREIQMRGATIPAVLFLEANRGTGTLDGLGMLFFDPVIRTVFGGDDPFASNLLADDDDIERLIDRLEELDAEVGLDA